jgi:hypothetical protein
MAASAPLQIYQFKITLKGVKPPIWRQFQVPGDYTFWDLHVAVQDAMGWMDGHLHAFHVKNPMTGHEEEIGLPEEDPLFDDHTILPGWTQKISQYFTPENRKAVYLYDFGDGWEHGLIFEEVVTAEAGTVYPRCVDGRRACPPEDCGGVWGYANMLKILSNPKHKEHKDTVEWLGEKFDPEDFDPTDVHFSDPAERLDMVLAEEDGFDDDEILDDDDDEDLPDLSVNHMREIWEKAKANELETISEEEQQLGRIMLEHKDEFSEDFERNDHEHDREADPDTVVNPFGHVMIHSVVENQLADREPIEVFQFYNAMRKKKCSHHDAIHLIGFILVPLMLPVVEGDGSFDVVTYCDLLRKYKTRNPEKIARLLEKEPMLCSA